MVEKYLRKSQFFLRIFEFFVFLYEIYNIIYILIKYYENMWAGPAQINGPGSAQGKGWVDLGPEYFLFSSWVGPGQTSQLG